MSIQESGCVTTPSVTFSSLFFSQGNVKIKGKENTQTV